MKTIHDHSIDEVNKAIRNNLFNRVAKYTLADIESNNPFAPRDNGRETILLPVNVDRKSSNRK